jgi:hypothetical protein
MERKTGRYMKFSVKQPKLGPLGQARGWAGISFGQQTLALATVRTAPAGKGSEEPEVTVDASPATEGEAAVARWARGAGVLKEKFDAREYRLATAMPCEDVLCHTLRLPATEAAELRQMLELQLDNLTPLPTEEIVYGFEPLETLNNETRVLVAVAPKAVVNERVAPLEQAKLPVEVVVVDALALFWALLKKDVLSRDEKLHALVQLTPTVAHIIAFRLGQPMAVRSVLLTDTQTDDAKAVLRDELQRTLVAVATECPEAPLGRLTFVGADAGTRDVAAVWNGQADFLEVESVPSPALSVCLEAAAEEKAAMRLNLLPPEWPEKRRKTRMRRLLIRSAIAGVALYLLGLGAFFAFMGLKQVRLNRLEADVRSRKAAFDKANETHGELVAIEKQLDRTYSALEVLREVSMLMPENLKLDTFNFKKDQSVSLRGQTASAPMATDFISRLENCPLFSKVQTVSMRTVGGLTKFEALCTLKSAAPSAQAGMRGMGGL